ncbi:stage V sporulation protein B [Desulfocucumis palustris]|uniref:Stage V sporulation protein B n=1 Tax=Desulfocucumis palustris TaxID=1898651 RepID=A0A2L2XE42_9FIRM|nr:polysaccharide biosynthesis protein [Desulfocucumis palustris]GBF34617.1 stage V sporulation protein B [Desulfocucumis palustris]
MQSKSLAKQTLVQGAVILTLAAIVVRVLGAVYRIPLGRMLGAEGLGIYGIPNQFYLLFFTISSAGIPVGVARLVSSKIAAGMYRDAYRTFQLALYTMLGAGLFFSLALFFGAEWLIKVGIVKNPDSFWGLRAVAPVVFFAAVTSAFRGLFQGMQNMSAVAASQIADQIMLVTSTLLFSYLLLPRGLSLAAAGANFGAVPGAMAATLIMIFFYFRHRQGLLHLVGEDRSARQERAWSLMKKVFTVSIPISFASVAMAITGIVDNILIIDRLQLAGYTVQEATARYGQLTQMAMSFINFSIAFSFSMGTSMVPSVAEAYAHKDYSTIKTRLSQGVRLSVLTSLPAAAGLLVLAPQLTTLVYADREAGIPLAVIAPAIVFWGTNLVLNGTLQGLGRADIPVKNLLVGLAVKIAITYFLTPTSLEIRAAAMGTVTMFIVASTLNILAIRRLVGFSFNIADGLLRPGLATAVMALGVRQIYGLAHSITGHNAPASLLAILAGMVIYAGVIVIIGGVNAEDVRRLPKIGRRTALLLEAYENKKNSIINKKRK